jgi:FkbM family methyltransferase
MTSTPAPITADDVQAAYRLLLGRQPESDAAVQFHINDARSRFDLISSFVSSAEFVAINKKALVPIDTAASASFQDQELPRGLPLFNLFPLGQRASQPGFVIDFLGTRTRTQYFAPPIARAIDGRVEGYPLFGNFHSPAAEWYGLLWAVLDAKEQFVCVELGLGWAPWLVCARTAALTKGIDKVRLLGVEASEVHLAFARQHVADNAVPASDIELRLGAVGPEDGIAEFPDLHDDPTDYGAQISAASPAEGAKNEPAKPSKAAGKGAQPVAKKVPRTIRVPQFSLTTLLKDYPSIDLIHFDIQGAELATIRAGLPLLNERVRWIEIGTHGRHDEMSLMDDLTAAGWRLVEEEPCVVVPKDGKMILVKDGVQIWKNPRR